VHNDGKVVFDGNANNLSQSVSTDGDHFYDVTLNTINNPHKRNLEALNAVLDIDHDLKIDKGCLLLLANSVMNVANDIAIGNGQAGIDASNNGITINVGGSWANSGNQAIPGDGPERGFKAGDSTVVFNSNNTGETIANKHRPEFYNITFDGAGSWNLVDNLYVSNDLSIEQGTFNASAQQIELKGDWTNDSTFTSGSSTVTLQGSGHQDIKTGGQNSAFNILTITNTGANSVAFVDTLYAASLNAGAGVQKILFAANTTHSISSSLSINGSGNTPITLASLQPGSQWSIAIPNSRNINFVNVQDSNNAGSGPIFTIQAHTPSQIIWFGNSVDNGNNTNWFAPHPADPPAPPVIPDGPKPDVTPKENTSISMSDDLQSVVSVPEEGERLNKRYVTGRYKTVVIVFEGKVVVNPYDEEGVQADKGVALTAGQQSESEGEIK
jgi:hypothetical protein